MAGNGASSRGQGVTLSQEQTHEGPPEPEAYVYTLSVTGMTCAACGSRVERALFANKGVDQVSVNVLTGELAGVREGGREGGGGEGGGGGGGGEGGGGGGALLGRPADRLGGERGAPPPADGTHCGEWAGRRCCVWCRGVCVCVCVCVCVIQPHTTALILQHQLCVCVCVCVCVRARLPPCVRALQPLPAPHP